MSSYTLQKDLIAQPDLWHLRMLLDDDSLEIAIIPPVENERLISHRFTLDPEASAQHKALESLVYANPLLLSDFKTVTCLLRSDSQMPVPASVSQQDSEPIMNAAFPMAGDQIIYTPGNSFRPAVLTAVNHDTLSFLQRTFYNIRFRSHFLPLLQFFENQPSGTTKIIASCQQGITDALIIDNGTLKLANSFRSSCAENSAYFLLAACQILGIDIPSSQFTLSGNPEITARLAEILTQANARTETLELPHLPFLLPAENVPLQLILPLKCE